MVLPVNTMTAGEALNLASMASLRGSQEFQQNLESIQKMRESREWASKEQKDMRAAQAKAATAEAEAKTMQISLINENPDLVRGAYRSGLQSQIAENMKQKTTADLDSLYMYFGNAQTADEIEMGIKNAMADGRTDLVQKLPPIEQMKQDPSLVAQVRMQLATGYQERAMRQKQELAAQDQKDALGRLGVQQQFAAGQAGLDRAQRQSLAELDAAVTMRGQDISRQNAITRAETDTAAAKPFPKNVQEALGETATNWKTKSLPVLVKNKLAQIGIDTSDKDTNAAVTQLAIEAGSEAIADWNAARVEDRPQMDLNAMADKLVEYYVVSGRFKPGKGLFGDPSISSADPQVAAIYSRLMEEPEFANASTAEKRKYIKQAMAPSKKGK